MIEISYLDAGILIKVVGMVKSHKDKGPRLSDIVQECSSDYGSSEATIYRRLKMLSDLNLIQYGFKGGAKEKNLTFINDISISFHNKYRINFNSLKVHYPSLPDELLIHMAIQMAAYQSDFIIDGWPVMSEK